MSFWLWFEEVLEGKSRKFNDDTTHKDGTIWAVMIEGEGGMGCTI